MGLEPGAGEAGCVEEDGAPSLQPSQCGGSVTRGAAETRPRESELKQGLLWGRDGGAGWQGGTAGRACEKVLPHTAPPTCPQVRPHPRVLAGPGLPPGVPWSTTGMKSCHQAERGRLEGTRKKVGPVGSTLLGPAGVALGGSH